MTVVVDIGCGAHEGQESIPYLLERFRPSVLYGVDPNPGDLGDVPSTVVVDRRAAWVADGRVGFTVADPATRSSVGEGDDVECFDVAEYLDDIIAQHGEPVVVKFDCEGAEYTLLDHLIASGVDRDLDLVLVEWHRAGIVSCDEMRADLEGRIGCPVEEWDA